MAVGDVAGAVNSVGGSLGVAGFSGLSEPGYNGGRAVGEGVAGGGGVLWVTGGVARCSLNPRLMAGIPPGWSALRDERRIDMSLSRSRKSKSLGASRFGEAREKLHRGLVQPRRDLRSGQGKSSPKASKPRHD